jgi:heme-degrading monooxygenase HmoA
MIVSLGHANADEAARSNVFGAWSDLIIGDRPDGLVDCYLLHSDDDDTVQVVAVWESIDHHDRALHDEGAHPAYNVFEAAGLDSTHTVLNVMGSIHQH